MSQASLLQALTDPIKLGALLWPDVKFYDKQREMIRSVEDNYETVVPSANQMGKDFTAAFIALTWFLRHSPCRIVITSIKDEHTDILWGELKRFANSASHPLDSRQGGPLILMDREIRKITKGKMCDISYLRRQVSEKGEGMAGHHSPYSLLIGDECSGLEDQVYIQGQGWAKRMLFFGNCNPTENFFRRAVDGGDILNERRGVA